jgi:tRNA A37 threonylcarbamoyltransferase TsaD
MLPPLRPRREGPASGQRRIRLYLAQRAYCTDNGAMIAYLGWHLYKRGMVSPLDVTARATM